MNTTDFKKEFVSRQTITRFSLAYKGREVEGTYVDYGNWDFDENDYDVIIENSELFTDEEIDEIEDYVLSNI